MAKRRKKRAKKHSKKHAKKHVKKRKASAKQLAHLARARTMIGGVAKHMKAANKRGLRVVQEKIDSVAEAMRASMKRGHK